MLDASLWPFSSPLTITPPIQTLPIIPFKYNRSTTDVGGDLVAQAFMAYGEYTFGGPIELMAGKSVTQGIVLSALGGTGVYSTIGGAIAFELVMDFLLVGVALTIIDPSDKWDGGIDEFAKAYEKNYGDVLRTSGMMKHITWGSTIG